MYVHYNYVDWCVYPVSVWYAYRSLGSDSLNFPSPVTAAYLHEIGNFGGQYLKH